MKKVKFIIAVIAMSMVLAMCAPKENSENTNENKIVENTEIKENSTVEKEHNCMKN